MDLWYKFSTRKVLWSKMQKSQKHQKCKNANMQTRQNGQKCKKPKMQIAKNAKKGQNIVLDIHMLCSMFTLVHRRYLTYILLIYLANCLKKINWFQLLNRNRIYINEKRVKWKFHHSKSILFITRGFATRDKKNWFLVVKFPFHTLFIDVILIINRRKNKHSGLPELFSFVLCIAVHLKCKHRRAIENWR